MTSPADPPSPFRLEPEASRPGEVGAAARAAPPDDADAAGVADGGAWSRVRVVLGVGGLLLALAVPLEVPWQQGLAALGAVLALVAAWPPRTASPAPAGRWTLAVGAAAAVVGPFVYANPWIGVDALDWPWTYWQDARRWVDRVDLLAWLGLAVGAGCAAASRRRGWALFALTMGILVLVRGHAKEGALSLVRVERVNLVWALATTVFAGAAVHLAGPSGARRGVARALLAAACLFVVTVYAAWFPAGGGGLRSSLAYYAEELPPMFQGAFGGAEADPVFREASVRQAWALGIPFSLQGLAVGLGLVVAALPSRARFVRFLSAAAVGLLLATWLVPARAGLWFVAEAQGAVAPAKVAQQVGETTMKAGLAVWIVGAGALAALLGRGGGAAGAGAAPASAPARRRRAAYVGVAALGLGTLCVAFHPTSGFEVRAWVFEVLASGGWTQAVALAVMRSALVGVPLLLAVSRPGATRGAVAATTAVLAFATLCPAGETWLAGSDRWVVPGVAAVAAGAAGGARRGSRALTVAAAATVLVLALYPAAIPARVRGDGEVSSPYESTLVDVAIAGLLDGAERGELARRLLYPPFVVLAGIVLTAVLALLAAAARSRALGTVARATFGGLVLGAPAVLFVLGPAEASAAPTLAEGLLGLGHYLLVWLATPLALLGIGIRDLTDAPASDLGADAH